MDKKKAIEIKERLGNCGVADFWQVVEPLVLGVPDPERAFANLERWLLSGGNPEIRAMSLRDDPAFAHRLVFVLGAAQSVADSLIQNPELAVTLADTEEMKVPITRELVVGDARALLQKARSYSHRLDRLRYLKQKAMLKVLWNDLSSTWEPEQVWRSLSELADGLLQMAMEVVWEEVGNGEMPVAIIALGKHGSMELNYSSDVDLLFVMPDEISDVRLVSAFCQKFIRAVTTKMGRGSLYRVDMRLRPFGRVGTIVHTLSGIGKYLRNYAEPWEMLALTRARACAGNQHLGSIFMQLADEVVYRGPRSEVFLAELVASKKRSESEVVSGGQDNIKLGPGGIRDIEFLVQLLQLLSGDRFPELRHVPTLTAIRMLRARELLDKQAEHVLCAAYRLFRQVEHRIQAVYDLQSHSLPRNNEAWIVLAKLMGSFKWKDLRAEIQRRRSEVRAILDKRVPGLRGWEGRTYGVGELLNFDNSERCNQLLKRLVAGFSDQENFLKELLQSEAARERLFLILKRAPRVVSEIAFHRELWDVAFSEIVELRLEEDTDPGKEIITRLEQSGERWEGEAGACARWLYTVAALKHAFHADIRRTCAFLTKGVSMLLLGVLDRLGGKTVDIVGLGGLGSRELLLPSDWDIFLLSQGGAREGAERIGEQLARVARRLAIGSSHFPLDFRLRPEGRAGLLVRSADGLIEYSRTSMLAWERIAFTRARSLRGFTSTHEAIITATYGRRWSDADEESALQVRARVHKERTDLSESERDIKLGWGFLFDIEWLVSVLKLRTGEGSAYSPSIVKSISLLGQKGVISEVQAKDLTEAYLFFSELRNQMYLLDLESDSVIPKEENALEILARACNTSYKALLEDVRAHQNHVKTISAAMGLGYDG